MQVDARAERLVSLVETHDSFVGWSGDAVNVRQRRLGSYGPCVPCNRKFTRL